MWTQKQMCNNEIVSFTMATILLCYIYQTLNVTSLFFNHFMAPRFNVHVFSLVINYYYYYYCRSEWTQSEYNKQINILFSSSHSHCGQFWFVVDNFTVKRRLWWQTWENVWPLVIWNENVHLPIPNQMSTKQIKSSRSTIIHFFQK